MSTSKQSPSAAGDSSSVRPAPVSRPLSEIADGFHWLVDIPAAAVTGITLDSRQVVAGDLYCALQGAQAHGADFADQAIDAGCAAILTDPAGADAVREQVGDFPMLVTEDPRSRVGEISSRVFGNPSERLKIIGITGTDGKTTTAMLAEAGLQASGFSTGLVGTIVTRIGQQELPSVRTTPEAPDLHALLAVMVERGVDAVAMEVSSHALVLGRVSGVAFDVAVFTNLGHDHLDFHGDQEAYFEAKAELFTRSHSTTGLVCVDDKWGRRLATTASIPVQTYSVPGDAATEAASTPTDWSVSDVEIDAVGWRFLISGPAGEARGGCRLPGLFNVRNALAAVAAVCEVGGEVAAVSHGVATCAAVPGRMQPIAAESGFAVFVDYAHTPDAVSRAIAVGRDLAEHRGGRLLVLLGCGGDRDRQKRPLMGEVAARLADVVVITDDNPRSEDPSAIRREIMVGVDRVPLSTRAQVSEIAGREEALRDVMRMAAREDVVIALGKGHESTQEVNGVFVPLDDRSVLVDAVARLMA